MPVPLLPSSPPRAPRAIHRNSPSSRSRTHRLKHSISTLHALSSNGASSGSFSSSFASAALAGALKAPPRALIADNGGKPRRLQGGHGQPRRVDNWAAPLPLVVSSATRSVSGATNETLPSFAAIGALPSLPAAGPVLAAAEVHSLPPTPSSPPRGAIPPAAPLPATAKEPARVLLSGFSTVVHPNDSPALGAPIELDSTISFSSALSSNRRRSAPPAPSGPSLLPPFATPPKKVQPPKALDELSPNNLGSSRRRQQSAGAGRKLPHHAQKQVQRLSEHLYDAEQDAAAPPAGLRASKTLKTKTRKASKSVQHQPASPSLDITSAFASLSSLTSAAAALEDTKDTTAALPFGLGIDFPFALPTSAAHATADALFDEAFPSPSTSSLHALFSPVAPAPTPVIQAETEAYVKGHRRRSTGLRELTLLKRRSWEPVPAPAVEQKAAAMSAMEETVTEEERFEDAVEDDGLSLADSAFGSSHSRRDSSSSPVGLGLGLGIDFPSSSPSLAARSEQGLGLGLGIAFGELEEQAEVDLEHEEDDTELEVEVGDPEDVELEVELERRASFEDVDEPVQQAEEASGADDLLDISTPVLSSLSALPNDVPSLSSPPQPPAEKLSSPRRIPGTQPRSPPRAKKVTVPGKTHLKRIYPRPLQLEVEVAKKRREKLKPVGVDLAPRSPEDVYYGSPTLDSLPGAFIASPVLPTSFTDFSHSPLPTPPTRFSRRLRRGMQQQQTAPLPTYMPTASAWTSSIPPSSTPGPSSPMLLPTSSAAGTPTLAASPTFSPSPSLAPSPSFAEADTFPSSAPGTPVPDQAVQHAASTAAAAAAASAGATAGGQQMSQAVFDAAIASTILGAVAAIGVLGWLAMSVFRRKQASKGISSRGIGSSDAKRFSEEKEDAYAYAFAARRSAERDAQGPPLTELPKVPPMAVARLSFPPSTTRQGSPTQDRSFSSHFDSWIAVSPQQLRGGGGTEDHGGYPDEVMRADGMSTYERRMSRASRMSMQSGYTAHTVASRAAREHDQQQRRNNRSSYRSSTGPSIIDSTWSAHTRPGTGMSSRTSHHGGSAAGDCFTAPADAGAPPRLPETIPPRVSGDTSTYFATPPGTPTKQSGLPSSFSAPAAGNRSSTLSSYYFAAGADEPPVPTLPSELRDYGIPPMPSSAPPAIPGQRSSTRARSGSRSTPSKAGAGSKAPLKSALKSTPTLVDQQATDDDSPSDTALKKLERRRATVDGGILADGLQALLFQAQLNENMPPTPTAAKEKDVFASSTPTSGSKRASIVGSSGRSTKPSASASSAKKARPQTMPPKIVVSDHPQPVVAPPTPARKRTSTVDTDILDARASMKTLEGLPWLAQSPSATFSCHPRDDVSVVDPEMRYERKHFSTGTAFSAAGPEPPVPALPPSVTARRSKDFSTFVAAGIAASTPPSGSNKHGPLDSMDIAARRLASEDDLASQSSANEQENDSDDEAAARSQRRKTLLYSVYKARGVELDAAPSPSPSSSATLTLANGASPVSSASRTTDSEDSSFDSPLKGTLREALVSSFPSPPPIPTASTFSNLAANIDGKAAKRLSGGTIDVDLDRIGQNKPARAASAESLKALARSRTYEMLVGQSKHQEHDIGVAFPVPDEEEELHTRRDESRLSVSPSSPTSAPPPRPPKSPVRMSQHGSIATSPPPAPSHNTSVRASPARQPLGTLSSNVSRSGPSVAASKPAFTAPPLRNFAAELQEAVNNPAEGYDSDTLMTALAFNKPGHSLWSSINNDTESLSASSSAYGGFASSIAGSVAGAAASSPGASTLTLTGASGIYSTNPGSIESLEEAAIVQAEALSFGRSRASGIPQFSWRNKAMHTASMAAAAQDESEESSYEESDAETLMWRTGMGTIIE
ncbi:hypothetical protein JCM10213_008210 [Rhodosporidiobolus nylandii]